MKENKIENKNKSEKRGIYRKADYKEFVKFYATPTPYKMLDWGYKREKDFAKYYQLSQDTLTDWKHKEMFQNDVDNQLLKWGADKTPDVISALYRTILQDGRAGEVKLWLQYIKRWEEKKSPDVVVNQPIDVARIAKIVRDVRNKKNNKR